ncbi:hypothetical protein Tco_0331343 [Tanacetum coccineum]
MKRGFRGAPRPLLPAMLLVATTNPSAGQGHPDVAQSQPSSSTIPVQSPPPIPAPIPTPTPTPIPTPTPTPIPTPTPTPTPIPETDPEPLEHTFEEPSPAHQHFSPPQEHAQGQMTKVKKLEGILKRRNVDLSDSEEEEPEAQGGGNVMMVPIFYLLVCSSSSLHKGCLPPLRLLVIALGGRRYKRRKESKGKKVVTSLDFQEEVSTGYAEGVNTGSIKVSTVSGQIKVSKKGTKEQLLQEKASLAEAIRLDTLQKEEEAKQVHLDSLLAQRIAEEEEELNEQQKKRRAQVQFEAQHYTA